MKKNKILIVEDESLLALGMQECLQNANYEVVAICNNGGRRCPRYKISNPI